MSTHELTRREVLAGAGAVFTTSLFTGRVKGANDRITLDATILVSRRGCWVIPNQGSKLSAITYEGDRAMADMNLPHWKNFECVRTRERPISDIETCVRSSTVCLLGNLAMRHKTTIEWDEENWTVRQEAIRPYLKERYRAPWKLEV